MEYPKEFIEKCKAVYPTWTQLHELLEAGNDFAGRFLDDSQHSAKVSTKEILEAKTLEEIQVKAKIVQAKTDLYSEWGKLRRGW
jgi:hypothetical protein